MKDCKITKESIRLESRKRSYLNIVKLILLNKEKDKEPEILHKPDVIRNKMAKHFQAIFNQQNVDENPNCIAGFLLSDNDPQSFEELLLDSYQKNLNRN